MLKTLSELVTWTTTTPQNEWNTWIEWQRQQQPTHYEKSNVFQYYLSMRPIFRPPLNSCAGLNDSDKYYIYCFGDFASLLVNLKDPISDDYLNGIVEYIRLLLDVYDVCKGYLRRLKGEPNCITMLRTFTQNRSLFLLQDYDYSPFEYPYTSIHAHTVVQYSLSTLIMRFVTHYLNHIFQDYYPRILLEYCQESYNNYIFGTIAIPPKIQRQSKPIDNIQQSKTKNNIQVASCPNTTNTCKILDIMSKTTVDDIKKPTEYSRCQTCTRITETTWGNFNACLDCHLKRICSICGSQATIISSDGLPKCTKHYTESQ